MLRRNAFLIPTALLAAATLAVAGIVYGLLRKEARRVAEASRLAAQEQARTVAENIVLTVAEAKAGAQQALLSFQEPELEAQLRAWQQAEPLAEFAFLWRASEPDAPRVFADGSDAARALESLRAPGGFWIWQESGAPEAARAAALDESEAPPQSNYAENTRQRSALRRQSLLSSQSAKAQVADEMLAPASAESTRWIHTRAASGYLLIGIANWADRSLVTGGAIRAETLREALASAFPAASSGVVADFQLRDERGEVFASSRASEKTRADALPFAALSLDPELPGWTLAAYARPADSAAALLGAGGAASALALLTLLGAALWLAAQSRSSQIEAARKVGFVANVSHELKTPLTTIRMFSELLRTDRVSDPAKRNRYLDTISAECRRLTRMVNNLLDFSQLERGQATLRPSLQPVVPLLESFAELRREEIARAGFALETDFSQAARAQASVDADALAQILGNLVDNALKYAADGKRLSLRAAAAPDGVAIELADAGPGLPRALRKARFKPFERGDTSLTGETAGFGLGLSIAQSLAEGMGARLSYRDCGDAPGARFVLLLPAPNQELSQ